MCRPGGSTTMIPFRFEKADHVVDRSPAQAPRRAYRRCGLFGVAIDGVIAQGVVGHIDGGQLDMFLDRCQHLRQEFEAHEQTFPIHASRRAQLAKVGLVLGHRSHAASALEERRAGKPKCSAREAMI